MVYHKNNHIIITRSFLWPIRTDKGYNFDKISCTLISRVPSYYNLSVFLLLYESIIHFVLYNPLFVFNVVVFLVCLLLHCCRTPFECYQMNYPSCGKVKYENPITNKIYKISCVQVLEDIRVA